MHHMLSNKVICFLNLFSLLVSIPIIGAGLWMTKNSTTCQSFLQKPLLIVGLIVLIISLAGFIGSYYQVAWALKVYLVVMLLLIVSLLIITIFGSVVTSQGGGIGVPGRLYREFQFKEYSPWLRDRLKDPLYWNQIRGCIFGSKTCNNLLAWTPFDYLKNDLTPLQSGCCKPPTSCRYEPTAMMMDQDPDCFKWNNNPTLLCYQCDSCKAGVLETIRRDWHKISILNVVMLVLLIAIFFIGCCAFRNTRRAQSNYPYWFGMNKARPRWNFYW
ncbi:unnamed protein product [Amaranthus hypochondriacus]